MGNVAAYHRASWRGTIVRMERWKKIAVGVGAVVLGAGLVMYARDAWGMEIGALLRTSGYAKAPNVLDYASAIDVVTLESGKPTALSWCEAEQKKGRAVLVPRSMYEGRLPKPGYPSSIISVPQDRVPAATKNGLYAVLGPVQTAPKTGADGDVDSSTMTLEEARLLTPAWSRTDFLQLENVCADIRCKPEDLLLVLCSESRLRPDARNPQDPSKWPAAVGLNQVTFDAMVMLGTLKSDQRGEWPRVAQQILDTPVGGQLEIVRQYFNATPWGREGHAWSSAAKLYQANAAPSTLYSGESKDTVIYPDGSAAYEGNKGLDIIKDDGGVTMGDLMAAVNYFRGTPLYQAALLRLNDARSASSTSTSGLYPTMRIREGDMAHAKQRLIQQFQRYPWFHGVEKSVSKTGAPYLLARVDRGYERWLPGILGGVKVSAWAI